jgi:hypothetical protein
MWELEVAAAVITLGGIGRVAEAGMAASSASDEAESRRRPVRANNKGIVDLAGGRYWQSKRETIRSRLSSLRQESNG